MSSFEKIITHVLKYFPQKITFIETYPFAGKNCPKKSTGKNNEKDFYYLINIYNVWSTNQLSSKIKILDYSILHIKYFNPVLPKKNPGGG